MSQRTVARRYAGALYEEADETDVLTAVDDDVLMLRETLESNGELARFFESPVIPKEKKDAVVRELSVRPGRRPHASFPSVADPQRSGDDNEAHPRPVPGPARRAARHRGRGGDGRPPAR